MTSYDDIPKVNALYAEQQRVQSAIDLLADGGAITTLTVAPASAAAPAPNTPPGPGMMMGPVSVALQPPNPPALITATEAALHARDDQISDQLKELGVTSTPQRRKKS